MAASPVCESASALGAEYSSPRNLDFVVVCTTIGWPMIVVRRLVWETGNELHIARHGVTRDEVEEVCHGDYIVAEGYSGRIMVVGPTHGGRTLAVVLAPRGRGTYFPVTAY